jgi:hypothetical protein
MVQIESFSSKEMQFSKRERRSSSKLEKKEENEFLKWEVKQLSISCFFAVHTSDGSFRKSIAFLVSHISLDLFLHKDSS